MFSFHFVSFLSSKRAQVSKTKISKKGRKNLIYLNSHRYYVVYCLYCLNISTEKLNASVPRLLLSSSQPFGLVTQRPLFWKRARCVTRPNNYCEKRLRLMPFLQQRENQNYSSTVYLKNITPRKANWNSVVPLTDPNERYIAILNKWRYIEQEKNISKRAPWLVFPSLDFALWVWNTW